MEVPAEAREEFRRMIGRSLASAVADVARIPDPGTREAAAGAFLPDALLEDPEELLSEAMDIVAGARGGPEVLAGMAVAAPTPVAIRARLLLEERGDRSAGLGPLCSREGASGKQLFSFVVETPVSGGAVKDGFVSGTSEGTRLAKRLLRAAPEDVTVQTIDPAAASERVVATRCRAPASGSRRPRTGSTRLRSSFALHTSRTRMRSCKRSSSGSRCRGVWRNSRTRPARLR